MMVDEETPNTYAELSDVQDVYGVSNVNKWADLDNDGVSETIAARVARACVWASNEVDSRLRKYIYRLPLANADDTIPVEIVDVVANLAGVWLYENRGVHDYTPDSGFPVHRLEWNRKRALNTIREILAGTRTLDALTYTGNTSTPAAVSMASDDD